MNDPIAARERGLRAHSLLTDNVLQEALREIGLAAHRAFEAAKTDDELRVARQTLDAAERFVRCLRLAVSQGTAAAKEIDRQLGRRDGGVLGDIGRRVRERREPEEGMPWKEAAS